MLKYLRRTTYPRTPYGSAKKNSLSHYPAVMIKDQLYRSQIDAGEAKGLSTERTTFEVLHSNHTSVTTPERMSPPAIVPLSECLF